jgi:polysaccharide pyruvyl transferase WcaK-like protein
MKIVFLHVYSEYNTGDAAIISVMLDDYRARYPGAEIFLSSITDPDKKSFKDAQYISSIFQEAIYSTTSTWSYYHYRRHIPFITL